MSLNPMGEFALLRHEEDPVDEDFHNFRKKHKREYKDKMEHQKRKHIFRHNLRFVNLLIVIIYQTRTQSLFIWLETILAEEIWSEINYAARGAFWEDSSRTSIYSRIQSSFISKNT